MLAALAMAFPKNIMNFFFVIWMVCTLIELLFKGKPHFEKPNSQNLSLFFFLGLFVWMIVSLLWTTDFEEAQKLLSRRIFMGIVPLFSLMGVGKNYNYKRILLAFSIGTTLSVITFLVISYLTYKENPGQVVDLNKFLEKCVTDYKHRTYFCLCMSFSIAVLVYLKSDLTKRITKNLYYTFLELVYCLFLGVIYFSGGRMSLIIYLAISILIFYSSLWHYKKYRIIVSLFTVILLVGSAFAIIHHPRMKNFSLDKEKLARFDPRYELWINSVECIKTSNKVFGTGIGDRANTFSENHSKAEFKKDFFETENSHNNFMDNQLELGLIGSILLLGTLFYGFPKNLPGRNKLFIVNVITILVLFMLIETVGNTSTTVYLFCFFILAVSWIKQNKLENL
jgi:hypothetical protein